MIFSIEDIIDINKKIDKIKQNNSNEKIVLELLYELPVDLLKKISDKDLVYFKIESSKKQLTVNEILEIEKTLDLFVDDIKNSDLSPYERYIAVYSMVKSFKEYKYYKNSKEEDKKYPDESRNVYLTLFNDYIVCIGYVFLLTKLLEKVGINSINISSRVGKASKPNHGKCLVNIIDPKYNIDGYFINDITNDNSIEEKDFFRNSYIHSPIDYKTEIFNDFKLKDFYMSDTKKIELHLKTNHYIYFILKKLDHNYFYNVELQMSKKFIESKLQDYDIYELKKINIEDPNLPDIIHKKSIVLSQDFVNYIFNNYDNFFIELQNHFAKKSQGLISPKCLYTATMKVKEFINGKANTIKDERKISKDTMKEINNYRMLYINSILKNIFNNIKKSLIKNNDNISNKHNI